MTESVSKSRLFNDTPYLPFQVNENQVDTLLNIPNSDIVILRELAKQFAKVAALPEQEEHIRNWKNINDLRGGRPVLWANEICWNEMNVDDELTIKTTSELGFRLESYMRRTLYQWKHIRGDMVVEKIFNSPFIIENTGFGIKPDADVRESRGDSTIASRHFKNQIQSIDDVEKIKTPQLFLDRKRTEDFYQFYKYIFDGIMPVEKRGCTGFWYAPWDDIVYWMSADVILTNLLDNPDLMHAVIDRLTDAYNNVLDQFVSLGLIASNNSNLRIGSGGYGYTDDLPKAKDYCALADMWGSSAAQIFGAVSPRMHKKFGINYEMKWLKRFGLNYYGCCEALDKRIDILSEIPKLRKISISPWAKVDVAAEQMKGRYVMSMKPSPASLAFDHFDENFVRGELTDKFNAAKDCCIEVIIKDISTVRGEPWRLWKWMDIAMEVARKYE